MSGWVSVAIAAAAFLGTHFVLSHPLRAPLVRRLGARGFLGIYSLVALATFAWMAEAYRRSVPEAPFWAAGDTLWALGSAITLVAAVLFVGSLLGNPALPDPTGATKPVPPARGVFSITRHPMMWGFALWALAHALVFPIPANLVLTGAIALLALVGAALQDRKKEALQPDFWRLWESRTSWWPFAALAVGKARFALDSRMWAALLGGIALWLAASWAHLPATGIDAGVWRWIG